MKKLTALFTILLIAVAAQAQIRAVESVNIIRRGYWEVVSPDTITRHTDAIQAVERQQNLLLSGIEQSQISIKPPLYDVEATYYDIYPDTVFLHIETELTRNVRHQYVEDSTAGFQIEITGYTPANQIRYASKCIGYDSTMTAIDERISMTLTPDSTGYVEGITPKYNCYHKNEGMNALATYWLTAFTDTTDLIVRRYLDVAHELNIGN